MAETKTWSDFIHEVGYKQAELFSENNLTYMECLVHGISFQNLLNSCYKLLVKTNMATEVTLLPIEEKQRLFEVIKEFAPREYTKEQYLFACSALYGLEYYLKSKT